jgi:pyruvate dehydrogenase E1 component alpha subunit
MVAVQLKEETSDLRRVLDEDGNVVAGADVPEIPEEDLHKLFEALLTVRVIDDRMMRLQRQGRLGFYMKAIGEEAAAMAVYALRDDDWVFPSYREQGAWFWRGYTIEAYIHQLFGNAEDPVKGRQMPVHHSARDLNMVSISSPVGTQIPQAVGTAQAMKIEGSDRCALTFFGEGTSSTGEFHVAMNFAGVSRAPVIFVLRNNGWAISTPNEKQTAVKNFASKAVGYGMPGVRVDGNDVLAMISATQEAVRRARAGEGPTLIEAVTYRVQGHSSSDDPSAYRDPEEPSRWEPRDPVNRYRNYLKKRGLWTQAREDEIVEQLGDRITKAIESATSAGVPDRETIFDDVYESMPWHIAEQREYLLEQPPTKSPHSH